jgi:uncharacterized membrane protein YtjA (UPF0391 family)
MRNLSAGGGVDPDENRRLPAVRFARECAMLYWAAAFFIIAIIAGLLGFGGVSAAAAGVAQILFFIFVVIFLITLIMAIGRRRSGPI